MVPDLNRRHSVIFLVLLSLAAVLLVVGWKLLWFLTDDAYICFRYVSNSMFGHGYVWNAAPFRPVEGYTNFLWVLVLDGIWRAFGITPPVASNYISLIFSFLALVVVSLMLLKMRWNAQNRPYRLLFLGLVLLGITTNRTFLTWSSSGLETAMFNFLLLLWVSCCIRTSASGKWFILSATLAAVGTYLTRPDGALFLVATVLILLSALRKGALSLRHLTGALPLLIVPAHLIWRRVTYGEWLPNSYYAKFTGVWPESGLRYALSFVLEYGLWVWIALFGYFLYQVLRRQIRGNRKPGSVGGAGKDDESSLWRVPWSAKIVAASIGAHALYYTLVIGGDHFEYRVYSHLIPLAFLSFVWMLGRMGTRPARSVFLILVFVVVAWPIPWTHWALTRDLTTREETHTLYVEVSDHWPRPIRWYAAIFDAQQAWLTERYVCTRHQEHKINCEFLKSTFPSREEGLRLASTGYPVFAFGAVGVVSWVLPRINIVDVHGINDYVIARNPVDPGLLRMMGHDRLPPPGYIECFRPNVELIPGRKVVIHERQKELTAREITECERRWAEIVAGSSPG